VDDFCLELFTKFWPGDLAFLEEFERVIADLLMDGIISGILLNSGQEIWLSWKNLSVSLQVF